MPDVRIDGLSFIYAGTTKAVLNALTLRIAAGEVVLLTGPSGCGKSTLALALAGLIPLRITGQQRGAIYLDETRISSLALRDVSQRVGIVFQNPDNQLVQLSVEEEVAFGPENLALPPAEIEQRVTQALEATGILALRHKQIYALSGGQKQRVAIAAALAMHPQVLVLDEPTSDLDPVGTQEVLAVLRQLNARDGMTIVLIEHKIDEVIAWVKRVLLMDQGTIVLDASPECAFSNRGLWRNAGVAVPQLVQIALGLPEIFAGPPPLSVDGAYDALRGTPVAAALRSHTASEAAAAAVPLRVVERAGNSLMQWQGVDLVYGQHQVLFDINLGVWPQEWVALIGANGSGKTSLASLVMGFQDPTRGRILVRGKRVTSGQVSRQARTIAYLFQAADTMLFAATVERELSFGLRHRRTKREAALPIETALALTDLAALRAANPYHLSHGQRKRLAIGALLMRQPATLILDEPTTGQDEGHARVFFQFLERLRAQQQLTYLMITHDMRAVASYATRVVALRDGRVALDGPPDVIFARRPELEECGILPPPVAQLHARLCEDRAPRVALSAEHFLRIGRPVGVVP